jgi:hypothetical protein
MHNQYKVEAIDNGGQFVARAILAQRLLEVNRPVER